MSDYSYKLQKHYILAESAIKVKYLPQENPLE